MSLFAGLLAEKPHAWVAQAMRDWLTGKRDEPPYGCRFECGRDVAAHLTALAPPGETGRFVPEGAGLRRRALGAWPLGIPVDVYGGMPADAWKLTVEVLPWGPGSRPPREAAREGILAPGKPTALERAYWLVDLHVVGFATGGYQYLAEGVIRARAVAYARAHGHEASPGDVKVTLVPPPEGHPWALGEWAVKADIAVPREPAPYPSCGDWWCGDEDHVAEADPVDEPAVFAGVVAERRYVDRIAGDDRWLAMMSRDLFADAVASRRRQAGGKPLWTIDVRPKS